MQIRGICKIASYRFAVMLFFVFALSLQIPLNDFCTFLDCSTFRVEHAQGDYNGRSSNSSAAFWRSFELIPRGVFQSHVTTLGLWCHRTQLQDAYDALAQNTARRTRSSHSNVLGHALVGAFGEFLLYFCTVILYTLQL